MDDAVKEEASLRGWRSRLLSHRFLMRDRFVMDALGINLNHADVARIDLHAVQIGGESQGDHCRLIGIHGLVENAEMQILRMGRIRRKNNGKPVTYVAAIADLEGGTTRDIHGLADGRKGVGTRFFTMRTENDQVPVRTDRQREPVLCP